MTDDGEISLFVDDVEAASAAADEQTFEPTDFELPYINEIVRETLNANHLCVIAKGLGLHYIAAAVIYSQDVAGTRRDSANSAPLDSENLVLILNATAKDLTIIEDRTQLFAKKHHRNVNRGINVFNKDTPASKRAEMYKQGGIYSVTSRIVTVDIITKIIDIMKITAVVILNAHKVGETSKEAFAIKLIRTSNRHAFISAFSDEPTQISRGINGLTNKLRYLGVDKVSLWPRFRSEVAECLVESKTYYDWIELDERTANVQHFLREIIQVSLSQLKRSVRDVDTESWTVDAASSSNLFRSIRIAVDDVYHKLGPDGKSALYDLEILQDLLHTLANYHPTEWLKQLMTITADLTSRPRPPLWLTLPASDAMFAAAKERVTFNDVPSKWSILLRVLNEVKGKRTLIICATYFTAFRLVGLLSKQDIAIHLRRQLQQDVHRIKEASRSIGAGKIENTDTQLEESSSFSQQRQAPPSKRRRVRGGAVSSQLPRPITTDSIDITESLEFARVPELGSALDTMVLRYDGQPVTLVSDINGQPDFNSFSSPKNMVPTGSSQPDDKEEHVLGEIVICNSSVPQIFEKFMPDAVILYDPNLEMMRLVEVHQSIYGVLDSFHFLMYQKSVEEHMYLSEMRKEKDAFSSLIRERGAMAMRLYDEPARKGEGELRVVNTRIAGGQTITQVFNEPEKIIVDAREFMSDLPFLLWSQNIDMIPMQLEVGDYILTPDCAVERKSISDLLSSFQSGRLFEQCTKMFRHYKRPVLLIEFRGDHAFSFDQFRTVHKTNTQTFVHERLAVLMLMFPRLRIIWSSSQRNTAEMFQSLKFNQNQPNVEDCAGAGRKVIANNAALDVLQAIPGLTAVGAALIAERIERLSDLAELSLEQLTDIVGREAAKAVTVFLDKKIS